MFDLLQPNGLSVLAAFAFLTQKLSPQLQKNQPAYSHSDHKITLNYSLSAEQLMKITRKTLGC